VGTFNYYKYSYCHIEYFNQLKSTCNKILPIGYIRQFKRLNVHVKVKTKIIRELLSALDRYFI